MPRIKNQFANCDNCDKEFEIIELTALNNKVLCKNCIEFNRVINRNIDLKSRINVLENYKLNPVGVEYSSVINLREICKDKILDNLDILIKLRRK
jgi:hypothetical protein